MNREIRVLVLGPTEALVAGRPVALGGPRQRRLLAALTVDAGQIVAGDRLVDRMWSEGEMPADPRRTVRTYIGRLRQALGQDDAIVTESSGWRLDSDLVDIDADMFSTLAISARAPGLDVHQRLGAFDEALALWRGEAYEDVVDAHWARPEIDRLTELRASAIEGRYQAMLDAGMHTDALPGLASAVDADPLRSRLIGLRMMALHRSGRQAEATRVFQAHRRQLRDELGLEPNQELVELDRRIIADDPSLLLTSQPGRALHSYRLGEQLGEGAFAVVYRGTQPSVGRDIAVKVIRAELANRPEFVRRFEAEAQLVARLEHPHIVPLYDYWREPDRACLVLRYLRGGTLEARLTSSGMLSLAEARTLVDQIGSALAAAHDAGVVHRDVKPANIFLDESGNYYLGDFGIALEAAELADPTAALSAGSPAYASPEQLRREPIGPPADIHGLGISIYEALTAQLPFPTAASHAELLERQLHDRIPSVRNQRADLPMAIDEVLARATAKSPTERFQSIEDLMVAFGQAVDGAAPTVPARRGASTAVGAEEARNPYKGLRAFTEADERDFFGRERFVDRLVGTFSRTGSHGRIAAVVGPSGIGKSSIVRAGLLPRLRAGAVPGSEHWFIATMVPGSDPYEELAAALLRVATNVPRDLMTLLNGDSRGIARVVKSMIPDDSDTQVLMVIDQFEELFTLVDSPTVRQRFLDGLEHAITDARCPLRVILTLRADFWDRPLRYGSFARLIEHSTEHVTALAPDELERAIVEPAHRVGTDYEPGLVSRVVADVGDEPGAMPLLQYALTELWDDSVSGMLTGRAYERLGGVAGAITQRADEIYEQAESDHQAATRRLFTRLVNPGEGTEDTRRRVPRSELGNDQAIEAVIDAFGAARLLSFDRDPSSREPTVEVAHEALIREWPRLRDWLDEDRDGIRVLRHLTTTSAAWSQGGREPSELYRGPRLEAALEWAGRHGSELSSQEKEFLHSSRLQQENEATAERRQVRRLRTALGVVAVAAVVALVAGSLAVVQQNRASDERARAEQSAQRADASAAEAVAEAARAAETATRADVLRLTTEAATASDEDPDLALLLALAAYDQSQALDETPGAVVASLQTATQNSRLLHRLTDAGRWVGLRPDGEVIATGTSDDDAGVVVLRDVESGAEVGQLEVGRTVEDVVYSPDGSQMVVTYADEHVGIDNQALSGAIYDAITKELLSELSGPCCAEGQQFSADGRYLRAVIWVEGEPAMATWDLDRPTAGPTALIAGQMGGGWTSDGRAVHVDASSVSFVDPRTGEAADVGLPELDSVGHAAVSPVEDLIAVTSSSGVELWAPGAATPTRRIDFRLPTVTFTFFTRDGQGLYLLGQDDEIQLVDLATDEVVSLRGHPGAVSSVETNVDDSVLAVGTITGEVLLWDLTPAGPASLGNLPTQGFISDIKLASDGSTALIGENFGPSGRARQFDLSSGELLAESPPTVPSAPFLPAAMTDRSLRVVAETDNGPALVVDLPEGRTVLALDDCEVLSSMDDTGRWVVVTNDIECRSPGGRMLEVETGDVVTEWETTIGMSAFGPSGTPAEGLVVVQRGVGESFVVELRRFDDDHVVAELAVLDAWRPFFSSDGRYITFGSDLSGGWAFDVEQLLAGASRDEATALNKLVVGGPTTFTIAGGGYLVTGHSGEVLRFWRLDSGEEWLSLPVDTGAPTMQAMSADGRYHYYADRGGVVRRFPLDPAELAELARSRVQRGFTTEECVRFVLDDGCPP